jgi:hypothetical protein
VSNDPYDAALNRAAGVAGVAADASGAADTLDAGEMLAALWTGLPEQPTDAAAVIVELARAAKPGLMGVGCGSSHGWIMGGVLPATLAANWHGELHLPVCGASGGPAPSPQLGDLQFQVLDCDGDGARPVPVAQARACLGALVGQGADHLAMDLGFYRMPSQQARSAAEGSSATVMRSPIRPVARRLVS